MENRALLLDIYGFLGSRREKVLVGLEVRTLNEPYRIIRPLLVKPVEMSCPKMRTRKL